jgi:hypothetical protein
MFILPIKNNFGKKKVLNLQIRCNDSKKKNDFLL